MDTLIEVHSDTMDIYISEEDDNEDSNDGNDSNIQQEQKNNKSHIKKNSNSSDIIHNNL